MESFHVKCGNETIEHANRVKYLSLQIDNDLVGNSFVNDIIKKVKTMLTFFI